MVLKLVSDTLAKVNSKRGTGGAASALSLTGTIVQVSKGYKYSTFFETCQINFHIQKGIGSFIPGVGLVGGALKLASNVLNPVTEPCTESSDLKSMRCELQSSISSISSDLKTIDKGIGALKSIATETYEMVVDIKHKEGIDLIDSNYDVFLKGLKNYEKAHSRFSGFIVELETKASMSFKEQNIRELLMKVKKNRGKAHAKHLASYVFIVRAKYLQIVTAFYLYDNDTERVEEEFQSFNCDVKQLQKIHKELIGEEFQPREPLDWELNERKVPCVYEGCSEDIPLNELIEHVNAKHGGQKLKVYSNGMLQDWRWNMSFDLWNTKNINWTVEHHDFSGHTFIPRFTKKEGIFLMYIRIMADEGAANKFMVDLEVVNPNNNTSLKCPGVKVYSIDMKWKDVIKDENGVLFFDQMMAKRFFSVTHKTKCEITRKVMIKKRK